MISFLNSIKYWLLPILAVVVILSGLAYLRDRNLGEDIAGTNQIEEVTQDKPTKGFAKPVEPTEQEKADNNRLATSAALHSGATSDCESITFDETLKQECLDALNYAATVRSNDETGCDKIEDSTLNTLCHNKVYFSVAIDQNDTSVCEKIDDEAIKASCLDQVNVSLAKAAGTLESCNTITSGTLKSTCLDNYILKQSTATLNASNCSNLSSAALQDQCQKTVASNQEVVAQSQQAVTSKKAAKSNEDLLTLCDQLDGQREIDCKDSLYPRIAFDNKDLNECGKISTQELISECRQEQGEAIDEYYLRTAMAQKDQTLCDNITDSAVKALCLNT